MPPIPLVCVGRFRSMALKLLQGIQPHFAFPAIIDFENYSPQNVRLLLATLNPLPAGVVVGGGFSPEQQKEIADIVKEHNASAGEQLRFLAAPQGTMERVGPEGLMLWWKEALSQEYGVDW